MQEIYLVAEMDFILSNKKFFIRIYENYLTKKKKKNKRRYSRTNTATILEHLHIISCFLKSGCRNSLFRSVVLVYILPLAQAITARSSIDFSRLQREIAGFFFYFFFSPSKYVYTPVNSQAQSSHRWNRILLSFHSAVHRFR